MPQLTQRLNSSFLSSVSYDPESQLMSLSFRDGSTREYPSVPPQVYASFVEAGSPGIYYHQNIKGRF